MTSLHFELILNVFLHLPSPAGPGLIDIYVDSICHLFSWLFSSHTKVMLMTGDSGHCFCFVFSKQLGSHNFPCIS